MSSSLHERHHVSNTSSTRLKSLSGAGECGQLGVRQRPCPQQSRLNSDNNNNNSNHNNTSNSSHHSNDFHASINHHPTIPPPPPASAGLRHNSILLNALAHPAQAAAAAAAAGNAPPRRGRKRITTAWLLLLTALCIAVVKYSGSLYDLDDYFDDNNKIATASNRRARLRSRTPDHALAVQLTSPPVLPTGPIHNQHYPKVNALLVKDRIVHALKAAFVADAASMGTHWIYNVEELYQVLHSKEHPEFQQPPSPKFYSTLEYPGHYSSGQSSPYGENLLFVAQYAADTLATHVGNYDDHPKSIAEPMSRDFQKWAETFGGRADHATLQFLSCRRQKAQELEERRNRVFERRDQDDDDNPFDNMENAVLPGEDGDQPQPPLKDDSYQYCGVDDDQAHFFMKVIPLTCLMVGHPHRRYYVEQAIRVHQQNDAAVLYGLGLSDLLERVLLMDENNDEAKEDGATESKSHNSNNHAHSLSQSSKPAKSLRDALDNTLEQLQEEHEQGWLFHLAGSFTQHHQQEEAFLDAWRKAKMAAEEHQTLEDVASEVGRSCHMPGALIVSLQALYRATITEAVEKELAVWPTVPESTSDKSRSVFQHVSKGFHYVIESLLGKSVTADNSSYSNNHKKENTYFVNAIRENILAAGDTCSRAIFMGAVLGAAYGAPPNKGWWEQLYPVLSGQVEEAAYRIAEAAYQRLVLESHQTSSSLSQQQQRWRE